MLPEGASRPTEEAIRELFRRIYGREPTEPELHELKQMLAPSAPDGQAKEC